MVALLLFALLLLLDGRHRHHLVFGMDGDNGPRQNRVA
jgi:hypothetical protein